MNSLPFLTLLTFIPLFGGIALIGSEAGAGLRARRMALLFHGLTLICAGILLFRFDRSLATLQFVERGAWIPSIGVEYHLGIDGLGLLMVTLTALVLPLSVLFTATDIVRPQRFHGLMLLLQSGLFGAFTAHNFIHWFLFYELSLVPAYFLLKLWGGPKRGQAARLFFIYTLVGSVTLLLSFMAVYVATGSFDFAELAQKGKGLDGGLAALFNIRLGWQELSTRALALVIFFGAFLGFAVKIPIWPFHSWLPLVYAEAPTPLTMVLTGAMSKLGVYGFLRILLPIFPEQIWWVQTPLLWLSVASVVLSALAALAQTDLKRVLGYLSISHLGYCTLGVVAAARVTPGDAMWVTEKSAVLSGVMMQMFSHGIIAATFFGLLGWMEQRSAGRRGLNDFGGLREVAPVFCGGMGMVLFASVGLPGLSGFIGEFLIFKGALALVPWAAVLSVAGLLVTAVFLLTLAQRVWHGPLLGQGTGFPDLTWRERFILAPSLLLILLLGIHPQLALQFINTTVTGLVEQLAI